MTSIKKRLERMMARKSPRVDHVAGGLGDKLSEKDVDPKQLKMGKKVEREHTNSSELAVEIALDHLAEDPKYYAKLKKIEKSGEVASVAVKNGSKLLMGKRNDNGRYTLPGGHLNPGEKPHEGAKRELKEEAGIDADKFEHLGSDPVTTYTGQKKIIHSFVVSHDGKTSSKNDPDKEVKKWEWIETKDGLPDHVKENLHSPKNAVLKRLKLLKAMYYVNDLVKARSHKYLRKYKRNGKWVYIYHEPGRHGRPISEEALGHIHKLAELGDEDARALKDSMEEHPEAKLQALRELHDLGDPEAKAHLHSLGINRNAEKVEDAVSANRDSSEHELVPEKWDKALAAVKKALDEKIFGYLERQYATSIPATKLRDAGLTTAKVMEKLSAGDKSPKSLLARLHEVMQQVDTAHTGLTLQNSTARDAGGYGNLAYNAAVKNLESDGIVPRNYSELHQRKNGEATHVPFKKVEKKMARRETQRVAAETARREAETARRLAQEETNRVAAAARAEADRIALGKVVGTMAHHMSTLMSNPIAPSEVVKLNRALKRIFGKDLSKDDWMYNFSSKGYDVKITGMSFSDENVRLDMSVKDANGTVVINDLSRLFNKEDGKPHIYNSRMFASTSAANTSRRDPGARISVLINKSQQDFLKAHTTNGFVTGGWVDVGAYTWANQGFSFKEPETLNRFRRDFKAHLRNNFGVNFSDADMLHFTEPCHFAGFHIGKYVEGTTPRANELDALQISTNSLDGEGQIPLLPAEVAAGKTRRAAHHVGKSFMLGNNWSGKWSVDKSDPNTHTAAKWFNNYSQMKTRTWEKMDEGYRTLVKRGKVEAATPRSAPVSAPAASRAPPQYTVNAGLPRVRRVRTPNGFYEREGEQMHRWVTANAQHMSPAQKRKMRRSLNTTASQIMNAHAADIPGVWGIGHEELKRWVDANTVLAMSWPSEKKSAVNRLYAIKKIQGERLL